MKKALLALSTLFIASISYAQTIPALVWVKQMGGKLNDRGITIAVDGLGNVYTSGYFSDTADFDPSTNEFNLIAAGRTDIFISKLDVTGSLVWAKQISGKLNEQGNTINVDAIGNVYVAGTFNDTVDFDPGNNVAKLVSSGSSDAFIMKLDASGNFLWVKNIGGTDADLANGLFVSKNNIVYVAGRFQGTTNFDIGSGISNLTSAGSTDIFVAKLTSSGNFVWVKSMGGTTADIGQGITADKNDNVFVTGTFTGTADFSPGTSGNTLTSVGSNDIFINKINAAGEFVWVKQFGSVNSDQGSAISLDKDENILSTGYFGGTIDLDPNAGVQSLTSAGFFDIYISKLDASGNFVWAKQLGGGANDRSGSIAVDASGNVYSTGTFETTGDFDPSTTTTYTLTSSGSIDSYISKLNAAGEFVWARNLGGNNDDYGTCITVDNSSNVYTTGFFSGTANFDVSGSTANLTSAGDFDVYVHKLNEVLITNSIDPLLTQEQIVVYPNPASDIIHVSVRDLASGKITITDIQGKVVYESTMSTPETDISINGFENGIYLLKVNSDHQNSVHKVVVAK